jgi:hypothetical protein
MGRGLLGSGSGRKFLDVKITDVVRDRELGQ